MITHILKDVARYTPTIVLFAIVALGMILAARMGRGDRD